MKNFTKYSALTTTTLLIVALAGPANATGPEVQEPTVETASQPVLAPVTASPTASVAFEKPAVTTVKYVAPAPVPAPVAVAAAPAAAVQAPVASKAAPTTYAPAPQAKAAAPAVTPSAPPAAAPSSGKGAALLASAYGQIGIKQDCTRMVENALASLNIISGDLAPAQFFRFGATVGTPAPGDIIISAGHVGIYAGNGQMISGGFNGTDTVLHPISYVGGYSAVRVA